VNDLAASPSAVDLDACAAEPIRIPGAIQPHGALLVVDPQTLVRLNASANLRAVTGFEPAEGESLEAAPQAEALVAELRRWLAGDDPVFLRTIPAGDRVLQVFGHLTPQGLFLEFEAPPAAETETLEALYPRLRSFLNTIASAPDLAAIAEAAVREIRALTGFNRILLYAFDEAGDGTVLAEATDDVLPSYLGLRFPAADIPAQARELYRLNRIRLIASSDYQPCPVTPAVSPRDGKPLDLSLAALRSVSPVHLEYMRNMGTGSSMSLSLLVNGQLWGLVSGHSREPRYVNAQVRTACDILGQVLSLQIEAREQADRNADRLALKEVETELLGKLALSPGLQRGLAENGDLWTALTGAAGAAVVIADAVQAVGLTPPEADILALVRSFGEQDLVAIDSLAEFTADAEAYAATASGVLAISISQIRPDYILWFRPEVVQTIDWSGDPHKPMEPHAERLSPRKSFEAWRQQVRLRSLPWQPAEVESARSFRNAIQDLVLRRAEERAELTGQLEAINRELESFSYSISHDLRAPFRHIVGYAELLSERERDLEPTSRHYLQSITDAAMSAGRLVDDLLNFSQLGRSQLNVGRVDLNKLVAEVRRSLEPEAAGRRVDWSIGPLPQASGDAAMLRQVFQNLLGNAVKYTGPREVAEISVVGEDLGDAVRCTVSDNGVGFDMAYVGKLFGVFQRLHRSEDFEGTGIGLALAKRIIDRHGGTIDAQGTLGVGASFSFTLPKRERAPRGDLRG
jgi:chemotaxis family two-component system sensor kinase Cph1